MMVLLSSPHPGLPLINSASAANCRPKPTHPTELMSAAVVAVDVPNKSRSCMPSVVVVVVRGVGVAVGGEGEVEAARGGWACLGPVHFVNLSL